MTRRGFVVIGWGWGAGGLLALATGLLVVLLIPRAGAEVLSPEITVGKTPRSAHVDSTFVLQTITRPAFRVTTLATPASVCRLARQRPTGDFKPGFMREPRGEASFELAFVGQGTCTIEVSGEGAAYHAAEARVSITVTSGTGPAPRSIPMGVRAKLLKDAHTEAGALNDRHPTDIQAVLTTEAAAVKDGTLEQEGGESGDARIYLLVMRGSFHKTCRRKGALGRAVFEELNDASGPVACNARYPVAEFAVLASDDEVEGESLHHTYPHLKSLGVPVRLDKRGQRPAAMQNPTRVKELPQPGTIQLIRSVGPRIRALAAASYSAGTRHHRRRSELMKKHCTKGEARRRGKCVRHKAQVPRAPSVEKPSTPEPLSATLRVLVYEEKGICATEETAEQCATPTLDEERMPLRISKLAANGDTSNTETRERTIRVAPGRYEVALADEPLPGRQVTVSAGQTAEVALDIPRK